MTRLFVYGTLRRDSGHPMARFLSNHGRYLGRASAAGRMYAFSWHPGVVKERAPEETVQGELYSVDQSLFGELDVWEGSGFQRRRTSVVKESGEKTTAWIYYYGSDISFRKRIITGDFLGWQRARKSK